MKNKLYLSLLIAILLCLAGWTAHAQLQRSSPTRQTWEYKAVALFGNCYQDWSGWVEDNKELPKPVDQAAKRAELGNQGWELAAVATFQQSPSEGVSCTNKMTFYYKRPK